MRKFLILMGMALLSVLAVVLTSCSSDDESEEVVVPVQPDNRVTMSVAAPDFVGYDQIDRFTVTISAAVERNLTVGVASSDPAKALVPDYVVLEAGKTQVTGKITPVANGQATIFIFCADADLNVVQSYDNLLVTHPQPVVDGEIVVNNLHEYYTNPNDLIMPAKPQNNYWICPIVMQSSSQNTGGEWKKGWRSACIWYHNMNWVNGITSYGKATIDNFGCPVVGKIEHRIIYMALLNKEVVIDNSLPWVENVDRDPKMMGKDGAAGFQCSPYIHSYQYTDNAGKSGYLVTRLAFKDEEKGIPFGFYRAWIEVNVGLDGSIAFEKVALCCNNREFKTGQERN